ncbi:hypothetical protein M514_02739 [Trichuris suis]|uniref:Uncharacterized protein n=1 Tax=Trichuris suis TaxID=68888 RepID=A0A085NH40_9BILA|nr:hypothetical protein M513_02739 [Trichuris suis]KFD68786.1 hypothetical protein M514_02739 [Trichuris suis]
MRLANRTSSEGTFWQVNFVQTPKCPPILDAVASEESGLSSIDTTKFLKSKAPLFSGDGDWHLLLTPNNTALQQSRPLIIISYLNGLQKKIRNLERALSFLVYIKLDKMHKIYRTT